MRQSKNGKVCVTKDTAMLKTTKALYRVQVGTTYEPLNRAPEGVHAVTVQGIYAPQGRAGTPSTSNVMLLLVNSKGGTRSSTLRQFVSLYGKGEPLHSLESEEVVKDGRTTVGGRLAKRLSFVERLAETLVEDVENLSKRADTRTHEILTNIADLHTSVDGLEKLVRKLVSELTGKASGSE